MYLPLHFKVKGKRLLFVGGGRVNERRILSALKAGASVVLVAPEATEALKELALRGAIEWRRRCFHPSDLDGVHMVFVAIPRGYHEVVEHARRRGVMVECASGHELGDFIFPAVVRRGDVLISVSTSGTSPALSKRLREAIENLLDGMGL